MSRYLKCVCLGCFAFKIPLCGTNFTPVSIAQHYTQTRRTHDKKKRIKFNDKTAIFYGIGRLEDAKIENFIFKHAAALHECASNCALDLMY